ncbi:MAG: hypothetical protein EBR82_36330 [Caulobacteraceae bacterium]|nr:hypothetical protein [Caulobacteraceae bacterium]
MAWGTPAPVQLAAILKFLELGLLLLVALAAVLQILLVLHRQARTEDLVLVVVARSIHQQILILMAPAYQVREVMVEMLHLLVPITELVEVVGKVVLAVTFQQPAGVQAALVAQDMSGRQVLEPIMRVVAVAVVLL